jgi:phospholipid N-methyltransferase
VDYDTSVNDFDAIEAYLRAADKQIFEYELGVHGSYRVVKAIHERGVATKIMQTYAWSRGKVFEHNSIYQYQNDIMVNAHQIDLNRSNGDAGGWKIHMAIQKQSAPNLPVDIANSIIESYLKKSFQS